MGADSKIEWTDATWNPVTGCTKVSPGCANCYAERMATRLAGRAGYPADEPFRVTPRPGRLTEPFGWKKPKRVFVCSMGDLFHDRVPVDFIHRVLQTVYEAHWHTFQVLTKRPARMREIMNRGRYLVDGTRPMKNLWLGVTAENQDMADERIPHLLETPAAVRFVSVEPMLGPVNLRDLGAPPLEWTVDTRRLLDWVIIGCESGPGRRPMDPAWAGALVRQCRAAGVPVFVKQMAWNGKVRHDMDYWPSEFRVREWPSSNKNRNFSPAGAV